MALERVVTTDTIENVRHGESLAVRRRVGAVVDLDEPLAQPLLGGLKVGFPRGFPLLFAVHPEHHGPGRELFAGTPALPFPEPAAGMPLAFHCAVLLSRRASAARRRRRAQADTDIRSARDAACTRR